MEVKSHVLRINVTEALLADHYRLRIATFVQPYFKDVKQRLYQSLVVVSFSHNSFDLSLSRADLVISFLRLYPAKSYALLAMGKLVVSFRALCAQAPTGSRVLGESFQDQATENHYVQPTTIAELRNQISCVDGFRARFTGKQVVLGRKASQPFIEY